MTHSRKFLTVLLAACAAYVQAADLSEQDYFAELPTVLTVTRLAQPLNETPGAVTILDRETIRRSGARDVTDVLRLVPGYMVSGFNGANPTAVYHAPLDEYGTRNLVLIDGRSVYSTHYLGSTHRGMMGVLLEDIERIEVLRGSNSAAYGANAMFGVINIVTRHAADTQGGSVALTGGDGGTNDMYARYGWGGEGASFRLSAGSRGETGYPGLHDDRRVQQLHFRGDLRPAATDELTLLVGVTEVAAGEGYANKPTTDPARTAEWKNFYVRGIWQRQLDASESLKLSASFDEEYFFDEYFRPAFNVIVGSTGRGRRFDLELQHSVTWSSQWRAVWGAGYKHEEDLSPMLFARTTEETMQETRVFGNLEWRPHAQWLINLGGYWGEPSSRSSYFSPRLMVNFLATPDHALRVGTSDAVRTPGLVEQFSYVTYGLPISPILQGSTNLKNEKLETREVGYFGNFRDWRLTLDVRGFEETMEDRIDKSGVTFTNIGSLQSRGYEYQARWKPVDGTELMFSQSFMQLDWLSGVTSKKNQPPARAASIAWFQKLPFDLDLGAMYYRRDPMTWGGTGDILPAAQRIDLRLARPFRMGSTRAEMAVVVQQANGSQAEYLYTKSYVSERRAFGTLRLEF